MDTLLSARLLTALEQLQLTATRRSKSAAKGERSSRARGQSVEFADHRSYTAGDDFRRIDWNLLGRLDKLFLKLYEEERELPVHVFIDKSESMTFGNPAKFQFALRIAAACGYVGLCGFDRVNVMPFPHGSDKTTQYSLRNVRGKKSAKQFFSRLQTLLPGGSENFNTALRRRSLEVRSAGVAFVLSDFLDPEGYEKGLSALQSRGFRVHVVQILSPEEISPGDFGDFKMIDSENGNEQEVTFGRYRLKKYQDSLNSFRQKLREFCTTHGMNFVSLQSSAPLETVLLKDFRKAGVWS